jgi:transcriptional regulator GlxA family with amidase domain
MSAVVDQIPIIKVLIPLHPGMDALDVVGPLEVLSHARHDVNDPATKAFEITFCSLTPTTATAQLPLSIPATIDFPTAYKTLSSFDILLIPGGSTEPILKKKTEPLGIIRAFSDLQKKDPKKERTLISICTGSLFLASAGILSGLTATTHPDFFTKFEILNSEVAQRDLAERCDVVEERYVVNNLRYDLGENIDENPYVRRKSDVQGRRPSMQGRKGSISWKESNTRRESNARRAGLRLGGLRVITSGGISCGLDASLYLVSIMVSEEAASHVEKWMQYEWRKGIVVDGIDI